VDPSGGLDELNEESESEKKTTAYFDVERYLSIASLPPKPQRRVTRIYNRVSGRIDNAQGLFVPFLFLGVVFGTVFAVVLSASYGPWAFLLFVGSVIGGLGLYGERKLGDSIQVSEYNILRKILAQALAFVVFLGILFLLLFIARVPPF